MNAANYNWTEPINRASDKPGEIQRVAFHLPERFFEFAALRSGMRPAGRVKTSEDAPIN
jgi:hypothetical protein